MPLKSLLITIALILSGCLSHVPKVPEHTKYGFHADIEPPGFYGVKSKDNSRDFKELGHPEMKGAQCLTAQDYKRMQRWLDSVIEQARCEVK